MSVVYFVSVFPVLFWYAGFLDMWLLLPLFMSFIISDGISLPGAFCCCAPFPLVFGCSRFSVFFLVDRV